MALPLLSPDDSLLLRQIMQTLTGQVTDHLTAAIADTAPALTADDLAVVSVSGPQNCYLVANDIDAAFQPTSQTLMPLSSADSLLLRQTASNIAVASTDVQNALANAPATAGISSADVAVLGQIEVQLANIATKIDTALQGPTPPVNPVGVVSSLVISQQTLSLVVGAAPATLTVIPKDVNGNVVPGVLITWVSSQPTNAPVDSTGDVNPVGACNAVITASAPNGVAATCVATVTASAGLSATLYGPYNDENFVDVSNTAVRSAYKTEMVALKAQIAITSLIQDKIQPAQNGAPNWASPDATFADYAAIGAKGVMKLFGAAAWCNGFPTSPSPRAFFPPYPSTQWNSFRGGFAAFCGASAARYPSIDYFEIWNEWQQVTFCVTNGQGADSSGKGTAATPTPKLAAYNDLYNACRTAIMAANPKAIVAWGPVTGLVAGPANSIFGLTAIKQALAPGSGLGPIGAISIHPYCPGDPTVDNFPAANSFGPDIARVQAAMIAAGYGNTPLLITEYGWPTGGSLSNATIAGYQTAALNLVKNTYSAQALGPGKAGVTLCAYFQQEDTSGSTYGAYDASHVAKVTGGSPASIPAAITAFMNSL